MSEDSNKSTTKRALSPDVEEEDVIKKVKKELSPAKADRKDDTQTLDSNPSNTDVIPESLPMETEAYPELSNMSNVQLLETHRVNLSKITKLEHHIEFLNLSLKQCKIPKGLQINKEYQVIDETEDFKLAIREILMSAEIETVQTIIEHYKEIHSNLCHKAKATVKRIEQLVPKNPDLETKVENTNKSTQAMKEKLTQKRAKKLNDIETHVMRTEKFASKKKEPRTHQNLNSQQQNTNRSQYQPQHQQQMRRKPDQLQQPQRQLQQPPRYPQQPQQQSYLRSYAAAVVPPPHSNQQVPPAQQTRRPLLNNPELPAVPPPQFNRQTPPAPQLRPPLLKNPGPGTGVQHTELDRNTIETIVATTIQNVIMQMSPFLLQQPFRMQN